MNLAEVREWVSSIDMSKVRESDRHHVQCYKDMIILRANEVDKITDKMDKYMGDIREALGQLDRKGLCLPKKTPKLVKQEKKDSLIPSEESVE